MGSQATKTYNAKSSVKRAILKNFGQAHFDAGKILMNDACKYYFEITIASVEKEKAAIVVKEEKPTETKTVTVRTQKDLTPERRESSAKSPCQLVWEIAEKMLGEGAKRKDIIAACEEAGVAFYTARTQYQKYCAAVKEAAAAPVAKVA